MTDEQRHARHRRLHPRARDSARNLTRTTWAEEQAARFCESPLAAEATFHSLRYLKGGLEKEVADILLCSHGRGILVSLKAQNEPASRDQANLERWCAKAARKAASQLLGALKTMGTQPFWCDHRRRGRVDFQPAQVQVLHAIAAVEVAPPARVNLPPELDLSADGVPVTYVALNDFLNLIDQLRTLPDLGAYLDARLALAENLQRTLGDERFFYRYFLHQDGTFAGAAALTEVTRRLAQDPAPLGERLWIKQVVDSDAAVVEQMADALATRAPDYAEGLDTATLLHFDSVAKRSHYLQMQEELCDLRLGERRELGRTARRLFEALPGEGIVVRTCYFDTKPGFLYVLVGAASMDRQRLLTSMQHFLIAALAHYGKQRGMAVATRPGRGYEFVMVELPRPNPEAIALGAKLFGHLKMASRPVELLPGKT